VNVPSRAVESIPDTKMAVDEVLTKGALLIQAALSTPGTALASASSRSRYARIALSPGKAPRVMWFTSSTRSAS
jgi:hypothetical protein